MACFLIGSAELKKIIQQVEPMLKGGIESTPRILFEIDEKVHISATNGDGFVKIAFDCNISSKGTFVVPGALFAGIIKQSSNGDIEVKKGDTENFIYITSGNVKYQIATLDVRKEIFEAPMFEESKFFTIDAQDLKGAISSVLCCIDTAKQHLNCVMIHTDEKQAGKLFVVSTDGMRLGIAERSAKYDSNVPNLMVPRKSADYILTMIGDMSGELNIAYNSNMIQISTGSITYTAKLLDTSFPKYQSVIPVANDKILEAKVADLKDVIKRISVAAEITFRIKMSISANEISISCEDNGNNATGKVEATYSDTASIEIVCNFRLLAEILEKISSSVVRFQIMDANTPILIRSVDDDTVKYVFMPFVS